MLTLKKLLFASLLSASAISATAQGTLEDYNRAFGLAKKYSYGYVPNGRLAPSWIGDTGMFWYSDEKQDGSKEYTLIDAKKGKRAPLLDARAVAAAMKQNGIDDADVSQLTTDGTIGNGSQPVVHKQEYAKPGEELRQKTPVIADIKTIIS